MAVFEYHGRPDFLRYILKSICANELDKKNLLAASYTLKEDSADDPENSKTRKEIGIRIEKMINMAVDIAIAKIKHQAQHRFAVAANCDEILQEILHPAYRERRKNNNHNNNHIPKVLETEGLKNQFKDVYITLESDEIVGPTKSSETRREKLLSKLNDEFWKKLVSHINWYRSVSQLRAII